MRKNLSTIILILIFLVGLSVMLYPSVSDAVNRKHQSRAVAGYAEEVEQLSDADYQTYFDAADAYNRQLNTTPNAFYKPDLVSGYAQTLDISGTGIMGYITIPKSALSCPYTTAPMRASCRWQQAIWKAAACPWAVPGPMRSYQRTAACPAQSCSPIWTSWRWATALPSQC